MVFCLIIALFTSIVMAGEVRYDVERFVEEGVAMDPQVAEMRLGTESKKNKISSLKAEAILPTFNVAMMVGPAPGLKDEISGDTRHGFDTTKVYDFKKMGPFWGIQGKFIQPLNLGQYKTGKKALEADLEQKTYEIEHQVHKKDVELQMYYYNYLLAKEMQKVAKDAQSMVDKAYDQLEEALDDDDPNVSQMDLLNLKAKMHTVREGVVDADLGMKRVMLAIRFSLQMRDEDTFVSEDTVLVPRPERLPTIDEVMETTALFHPELKQLNAGLRARRIQVDLAEAKLAPEFFVMGEFEYVKSWAGNRNIMVKSAFAEDAVNKLEGAIGVGVRYHLNFWKNYEKYRMAKTDYRLLQAKDNYAAEGLKSKAMEQYYQVVAAKEKMDALKESLRASEAILKGAAMQYDLDKSKTGNLVSAYTQNVTLQKDYYFAVCKYNVEYAQMISAMGMSLKEYRERFMK